MILNSLAIEIIFKFLMVIIFGFLTGLELREYIYAKVEPFSMGTTRTFTFIAILGFILNMISINMFLVGFIVLSIFLMIFYIHKINKNKTGILQILIALMTYTFGALIDISIFLVPLIYVAIVFIISSQSQIIKLTKIIDNQELITFSKFLILSVIILPILPKENIIPYVSISPFKIWVAVVVVSTISYISYILQKYFLANSGIIVTGILGGVYSSTATTVVLAKKGVSNLIEGSIVIATGVMYLRLFVIIAIFNFSLAKSLLLPFVTLFFISFIMFLLLKQKGNKTETSFNSNPLEMEVAFIFALLFIIMAGTTQFITTNFGNLGLEILSVIVGFTDIDPFILSLIQGKYVISNSELIQSILIAVASNNILKAIYTGIFSKWKMKKAFWNLILLALFTLSWVGYYRFIAI